MNKQYRVGIIGPGGIAKGAHIPCYQKDGRAEVVAVCSRTEKTALEAANEFSIAKVYTSIQEMLQKENLDVVSVCTPNKFHAEGVIAALEGGCHVLCEKPPALSASESIRMEEAARNNNKQLLYAFNHRHNLETKVLKRAIESGDLGRIYHVNVQAMRRRGIPGWGVFTNKELQGGGPLIDVGVHMLDLALYLTDFPKPREVMGVTHQRLGKKPGVGLLGKWDPHEFTVEDLATGMIRFENGMSLVLETSYAANIEKDEKLNVSLLGDKGGADVNPLKIYEEKYGALFDKTTAYLEELDEDNSYQRQISHFIDVIEAKTKPIVTPAQGTYVQIILDALYESARQGKAIQL